MSVIEIGSILEWLRSPQKWFALFMGSGFLAFVPAGWLAPIGMSTFRTHYTAYIGMAFVASAAMLISEGASRAGARLKLWRRETARKRGIEGHLSRLTGPEKAILRGYAATETQYLDFSSGVVGGLVGKGIIYRCANAARDVRMGQARFAYNIHPWIREYCALRPDLLEEPVSK